MPKTRSSTKSHGKKRALSPIESERAPKKAKGRAAPSKSAFFYHIIHYHHQFYSAETILEETSTPVAPPRRTRAAVASRAPPSQATKCQCRIVESERSESFSETEEQGKLAFIFG